MLWQRRPCSTFRITSQRGEWRHMDEGVRAIATWHPSAILRMPRQERRHTTYGELVRDLREVATVLAELVGDAMDAPA